MGVFSSCDIEITVFLHDFDKSGLMSVKQLLLLSNGVRIAHILLFVAKSRHLHDKGLKNSNFGYGLYYCLEIGLKFSK